MINGVAEIDTANIIFAYMANSDTLALLRCRSVSMGWRNTVDSQTLLWSRMSLRNAIRQNRIDICQLIVKYAPEKNCTDRWRKTPLHEAARRG